MRGTASCSSLGCASGAYFERYCRAWRIRRERGWVTLGVICSCQVCWVIGEGGRLAEFIPVGLDEEQIARIHHWPEGRGLLGELISDPRPLRLPDVSAHPRSFGFPEGHPPMKTVLGAPVRIRDEVYGNLYLTEKEGGAEFDEEDEAVLAALGAAAGGAIGNARLYDGARRQQRWPAANAG